MAEGYVEFYVTTNPPLLPNGVSSIIKYATGDLYPDKAVEILYEPDVPWFKIISPVETRAEVCLWFETYLERSLELDLGALDIGFEDDSDFEEIDELGPDPDIEIVQPDAHVISWARYQDKSYVDATEYDQHRFPHPLAELQHKRVWRGLESVDGLTLSKLLSEYRFLWGDSHTNVGLEKISALSRCEITHNMNGNLVYIGSDHHANSLGDAIQKLETFLWFRDTKSSGTSHLVFTEGSGPFEIFQSYLSHLGLFRMTYVEAHHPDPRVEYQRMTEATSLRAAKPDSRGQLTFDKTTYAAKAHPNIMSWKSFSAFEDYPYRNRKPFREPLPKIRSSLSKTLLAVGLCNSVSAGDPCFPDISATALSSITQQLDCSETPGADASLATSPNPIPPSEKSSPRKPTPKKTTSEGVKTLGGDQQSPSEASGVVDQPASPVEIDSRASDAVSYWIDTVEKSQLLEENDFIDFTEDRKALPTSSETLEVLETGPMDDDQVLIDLSLEPDADQSSCVSLIRQSDAIVENENTGNLLVDLEPGTRTPKATQSSTSFEDILDRESPRKQFHGMFAPMKPLTLNNLGHSHQTSAPARSSTDGKEMNPETDLLDSSGPRIHTAALMDTLVPRPIEDSISQPYPTHRGGKNSEASNQIATFQRQGDTQKDIIETMRQKASKSGGSWAQIAGKAKAPTLGPAPDQMFGPNVKETYAKRAGGHSRALSKDESTPIAQPSSSARSIKDDGRGSTPQRSLKSPIAQPEGSLDQKESQFRQRIVPGLESSIQSPQKGSRRHKPASEGHKAALQTVDTKVKNLMRILQITPGYLTVEAKFGRACIKGLPTSVVGSNTTWLADGIARELNEREGGDECLSFCTMLTTNGDEAEILLHTQNLKGGKWTFHERNTFFDIRCSHAQQPGALLIELNADTFEYHCRHHSQQDLSSLVIHCAQRAWDIKVCLARALGDVPGEFKDFAQELVASLGVATNPDGRVVIDAKYDGIGPYSVNELEVRRVARYHNGVNGSCLTVTNTVRVNRDAQSAENKSAYRGSVCRVSRPGIPEAEPPASWFEASIKSNNLQEVLKENIGLDLGESTRWQPEHLGRLIEEIVDPALRMVTEMDDVGVTNDNGYRTTLKQPFYDPVAAEKERDPDYSYW